MEVDAKWLPESGTNLGGSFVLFVSVFTLIHFVQLAYHLKAVVIKLNFLHHPECLRAFYFEKNCIESAYTVTLTVSNVTSIVRELVRFKTSSAQVTWSICRGIDSI